MQSQLSKREKLAGKILMWLAAQPERTGYVAEFINMRRDRGVLTDPHYTRLVLRRLAEIGLVDYPLKAQGKRGYYARITDAGYEGMSDVFGKPPRKGTVK